MTAELSTPLCPHCGRTLQPFELPETSGWDEQIHFACFSDDCGYFRRGWSWMFDNYGVKASYRYRVDPASGSESPLPVWSKDAIKDRIIDAEVSVEPPEDHSCAERNVRERKTTARRRGAGNGPPLARPTTPPLRKGTTP